MAPRGGRLAGAGWLLVPGLLGPASAGPAAALDLRIGVALDRPHLTLVAERAELRLPEGARAQVAGRAVIGWIARDGEVPAAEGWAIQVGALASEERAREMLGILEPLAPPVALGRDLARGLYRVQGGRFASREQALASLEGVRAVFPEAFVTERVAEAGGGIKLLVLGEERVLESRGPVLLAGTGDGTIAVDGVRYRGSLEVRAGSRGLVAVNIVDLEEYLRGVVPREMGPAQYPELEALAAQAVAARTYAVANRGQSAAEGYDLCATARCQVYGGRDAEHELTDRAVAETRGMVLAWQGEPVKAFFSATCGGHTEDVEKVFLGEAPAPYLRGGACGPEAGAEAALPQGRKVLEARAEDGRHAGAAAAILAARGILDPPGSLAWLRAPPGGTELSAWVAGVGRVAGRRTASALRAPRPLDRGSLGRYLVVALDLEEQAQVLLSQADLVALGRSPDAARLEEGTRRALALLDLAGCLRPLADGRLHPEAAPSRGLALALLARLLPWLGSPFGEEQVLVRLEPGRLVTRARGVERALALDGDTVYLREVEGDLVPAGGSLVLPGDALRVLAEGDRVRALTVLEDRSGNDDRRARSSRWVAVLEKGELESRLRRELGGGELVEIRVAGRARSSRPLALVVRSSRGERRLEGYPIKSALGLKDDLFVAEPVFDGEAGTLKGYRFLGRGWGHGVGLCQEGAYGMALRGASREAILARYYPGARLQDLESLHPPEPRPGE